MGTLHLASCSPFSCICWSLKPGLLTAISGHFWSASVALRCLILLRDSSGNVDCAWEPVSSEVLFSHLCAGVSQCRLACCLAEAPLGTAPPPISSARFSRGVNWGPCLVPAFSWLSPLGVAKSANVLKGSYPLLAHFCRCFLFFCSALVVKCRILRSQNWAAIAAFKNFNFKIEPHLKLPKLAHGGLDFVVLFLSRLRSWVHRPRLPDSALSLASWEFEATLFWTSCWPQALSQSPLPSSSWPLFSA